MVDLPANPSAVRDQPHPRCRIPGSAGEWERRRFSHRKKSNVFLAVRDIRFAKGRFTLMGAVVALISLLLVMLSGLTAGLADQSTSAISALGADRSGSTTAPAVDAIAFGAPGSAEPKASFTESAISPGQLQRWQDTPGVRDARALGISQARVQAVSSTSPGTSNVTLFGVDPDGGLAPAGLTPGSVLIGSSVAKALAVQTGDQLSLNGTELSVGAVVPDQWYSHTSVLWLALPAWRELAHLNDPGQLATVAAISYQPGATVDQAAADAGARTVSSSLTGSFQALASYRSENGSLLLMQAFLYGITALVIVAFLTVWTIQRTRDIAVLKALGAGNGFVLRDAIGQAAIVLVSGAGIGGAVGVAGGILAAQAAPFLLTPATVLLPVLGIIVLGLAGAAVAVRRVTKINALVALGGN